MNADELDRRARTYDGWIPPWLVSLLIEQGHIDEVRLQARNGDWFCARAWAQTLIEQGQRDAALDVLAPFVDAGWAGAAREVADILDGWGRAEEAIALVRPYAETGERLALEHLARLLDRSGRKDEAFELLRPHTEDWFLAEALVDVTAGLGRDEEVAGLLEAHVEALRQSDEWWCAEPMNAVELLARVRERQGRIDEAVALLHTTRLGPINGRDQLADLLVRHGRENELRDYVAGKGGENAAYHLVEFLEERGDVEGAIEVLRPFAANGSRNSSMALAELLTRHGRADEAIEVLLPVPSSVGGDCGCALRMLWTLMADHGRADEALAVIDDLAAQAGDMSWELFHERARLLTYCGRTEQAITEVRAHPEADTWYGAGLLSDLLTDAGRLDEAIAVLQSPPSASGGNENRLAELLIRRGRVKDAITVLHHPKSVSPIDADPWVSVSESETPPF
ncbi:tetratricopeptide repeat protein [Thermomonospora amylolytica]|uniref:tetratricopeptide repeat protein n=1 Tax=Thermomonospora amylolytica TaxID=1411117 RepID=UPI0018E4DF89|nr:tetratricopeptide repeat protein [Thermomonospora amylolytica]